MKPSPLPRQTLLILLCCLFPLWAAHAAVDVRTLGLKGDGVTDDTGALEAALAGGNQEFIFPAGTYLLGTVDVPSHVTLRGEAGTRIRINPAQLRTYDGEKASKTNLRCLFALKGESITLADLHFDFTLTEDDATPAENRPGSIILGRECRDITLSGLVAERPQWGEPIPVEERRTRGVGQGRFAKKGSPANKAGFHLSVFYNSTGIVLRDSRATFLNCMIDLIECSRVWSLHNRASDCYAITRCKSGNEFLWHMGNWSRNVSHQCRWFGGNANDRRNIQEGHPGWGTSRTVIRGSKRSDPDFNKYTQGEYDIMVVNNYAEYGQTLAWGSKGRQILFQGNTARFMTDYALGSEGGEEVVFNANTTINSYTAGLVAMYWSEKLVMQGNLVLVKDEPIEMQYSTYSTPAPYQGGLIRLHSASSPGGSGSGQVLITGNLLVSEMKDRPRRISIEAGRDVQITGNKIRNGGLRTKGSGHLVLTGNDFVMTVPHSSSWISLTAGLRQVVMRGNTFRNTRPAENRSPTEFLICAEANAGKSPEGRLRIIEDNLIEGFPLAIWARALAKTGSDRFLIRNNTTDGTIRMEGLTEAFRLLAEGNVSLDAMQVTDPEILHQFPEPLPEPVPTAEDAAAADSEAGAGQE